MSQLTDKLNFFWFIPTYGDGAYLGSEQQQRAPTFDYFRQIAQAVEYLGYQGVLLPTGKQCEDSWVTASALAAVTTRLKYLIALRPGIVSPTYAARQSAAIDRLSNGRALFNIVVGGNPAELAGDGLFLSHDERYHQANEFLTIWRALLSGQTVNFKGDYYHVENAKLNFPPVQHPHPPLYFGGSSEAGVALAAKKVELYLTWGEPLEQVAEKIFHAKKKAAEEGRTLRFGIRLHFIVRPTEEQAWQDAEKLIQDVTDEQIARAQHTFLKEMDSVGQRRMASLHGGRREKLLVGPNLWAGIGLIRGGAGTALVGSPQNVAARLREYQALGIDTVIGSGYPHLEEAYQTAELLFPLLGINQNRTAIQEQNESEFHR